MAQVDVAKTYGALLLGGMGAVTLSGVVIVQSMAYFKSYPSDLPRNKLLVTAVWLLDLCHSSFICASIWDYLILNFGNIERIDFIPWTIAITILLTAVLTFLVHCFFVHRIHKLSKSNWYITTIIGLLACLRLAAACTTTGKMIYLRRFSTFVATFRWAFTMGLVLSSALDILITGLSCYYLLINRKESSSMNHVIDTLILYAFENGSLTCAATIVSLICWLSMPHNLIFMGLHFIISKLYANSLLATLNTRQHLQRGRLQSSGSGTDCVVFPDNFGTGRNVSLCARPFSRRISVSEAVPGWGESAKVISSKAGTLCISVVKTTEYAVDEPEEPSSATAFGSDV